MSKRQLEGAVETAPPGAAFDAAEPTLIGKVVLVTGASSGIGRAIAVACAAAGADVALTYRANRTGADETAQRVRSQGRRAELLPVDLTETRDLEALAALVRGALGRVDVWVNNAGADILTGAAARLSWVEKLDRLLAVDLRGTVLASWKAVDSTSKRWSIPTGASTRRVRRCWRKPPTWPTPSSASPRRSTGSRLSSPSG